MRIVIEFQLEIKYGRKQVDKYIRKELTSLKQKIEKYKTSEQMLSTDIYQIEQDNSVYYQITDFARQHPKEIDLHIVKFLVDYEKDELEKAVAFVPQFSDWCEEYDDVGFEYEECKYCYAHLKEESDTRYIMPKGFVKKKANEYGVLRVDTCGYDRFMVLPELYKKLIEEGIPDKYFAPACSKKGGVLAYELVSDNVLPENSYENRNYFFRYKCSKCGALNYGYDLDEYYYMEKTINQEGVSVLKETNMTKEYYDGHHQIMVNKFLHDLIIKYVPSAQFIPIFKR